MRWRGIFSLVVLWLTFAALHDITLDNGTSFTGEYTLLVVSGAWFTTVALFLAVRLHRRLAAASLALVALGLAACWSLPHYGAPPSLLNYLAWVPMLWFFGVAVWMISARPIALAARPSSSTFTPQ